MRPPLLLCAAALLGAAGCGIDTDPTIFVDATVEDPSVHIQEKALGGVLTGGFTLSLHLGARAADTAEVDLQGFELTSEDKNTLIVESLPLAAADGRPLPLLVEPGTDEDVAILISYGSDLVAKEQAQKLCSFGSVHFRGSIHDSLRGTAQPVVTETPVPVTGCATP